MFAADGTASRLRSRRHRVSDFVLKRAAPAGGITVQAAAADDRLSAAWRLADRWQHGAFAAMMGSSSRAGVPIQDVAAPGGLPRALEQLKEDG
jgi:hypothetical protein